MTLFYKIDGPAGSGKSWRLTEYANTLARRASLHDTIASAERPVLLIAINSVNKQRLAHYLALQDSTSSVRIQTWQEFLETQLRHIEPNARLLGETESCLFLARLLDDLAHSQAGRATEVATDQDDGFYPLAEALQHPAVCRTLYEHFQKWLANPIAERDPEWTWANQLFEAWRHAVRQEQCYPTEEAVRCITNHVRQQHTLPLPCHALCVDEAQELSIAQFELLESLAKEDFLIGLSGNTDVCLRQHKGASPERFAAISAITTANSSEDQVDRLVIPQSEQPKNLTLGYFQDPVQEMRYATYFIQQHVQFLNTAVADPITGNIRPCRWEDIAILSPGRQWEPLIIEALESRGIPVATPDRSLDDQHLKPLVYDLAWMLHGMYELAQGNLSYWQRQEVEERCNNHAGRLLEHLFPGVDLPAATLKNQTLQYQPRSETTPTTLPHRLLAEYTAYHNSNITLSAAHHAVVCCQEELTNYQVHGNPGQLIQALFDGWLKEALPASDIQLIQERFIEPLTQFPTGRCRLEDMVHYFDSLWTTPSRRFDDRFTNPTPAVQVLRFYQAQGEHFPIVLLPFCTDDALGKQEAMLTQFAMERATHTVWLSTHHTCMLGNALQSSVQPTQTYLALLKAKHQREKSQSPKQPCGCLKPWHPDWCPHRITEVSTASDGQSISSTSYEAVFAWGQLDASTTEPVLNAQEPVTISPTGINSYLNCPRQYFYRQVLRLPQQGSTAANLGILVHRIMEVFNTTVPVQEQRPERLKALAEILFQAEQNPSMAHANGFQPRDWALLKQLSPVAQVDLKTQLLAAIDDLASPQAFKNYFGKLSHVKAIEAEKPIRNQTVSGLSNCLLNGKIDAILALDDGSFELVDYKFYGPNRKNSTPQRTQENWQKILEPLPTNESGKAVFSSLDSNPRDYQLPLYYLALNELPEYAGKIRSLSLQLIRPAFGDQGEKGSTRLEITREAIEAKKETILADLQQHVIQRLQESDQFEALTGPDCRYCSYLSICDVSLDDMPETQEGVNAS